MNEGALTRKERNRIAYARQHPQLADEPHTGQRHPVTKSELEKRAGRRAPTEAERRIAARVVVKANKACKVETPKWVKTLAKTPRHL